MTYGHLQADCLYTGISSGPNARCRVWEAFTFLPFMEGPRIGGILYTIILRDRNIPHTYSVTVHKSARIFAVALHAPLSLNSPQQRQTESEM